MSNEKTVQAQLDEAKHAKQEALHAKQSAKSEHESAQAVKGEVRVKQPDDFSML